MSTHFSSAPADGTPGYRHGRFNVYAAYDDQEAAQAALVSLGRAGFEGASISLHGPQDAVTPEDTAAVDGRVMTHWVTTVLRGAAVGAVAGFIIGVPVGAVAIATFIDRDLTFGNVLVSGFIGALFLSTIFALWSMIGSLQGGDAWDQSFQELHGRRVIVGVHVNDRDSIEHAAEMLAQTSPVATSVDNSVRQGTTRRASSPFA